MSKEMMKKTKNKFTEGKMI